MSLHLRRRADLSAAEIARLETAMAAFYRHPPARYYQMADHAAQHYTPGEQPFHCDLVGRVLPGDSVLEVGCGTAHLCPYVEARRGNYIGLDYSERLLAENRQRHLQANFFPIGTPLAETFDIVASLYTIEHIVDPPAYLETLWKACRPGGLVAVICPEFVECPGLPLSVFYGRTPRRLRDKLKSGDLLDALTHLFDLKFAAPRWQRRARSRSPGDFWINLRPSVLHGAEYAIDADAVHLVQRRDLVRFFEDKGATIVQTSASMPDISPAVLRHNCYVVARKPSADNFAAGAK